MKKAFSFFLCCILAMSFAACKKSDSKDDATPQNSIGNEDGTVKDNYDWIDDLTN